jgi:hypothetical protein
LRRLAMARLVMVAGVLVLTAVLLAGCGGGTSDAQAKVEASLRHYLVRLGPEDGGFPIGAGSPRVRGEGCFKLKGAAWPFYGPRPPGALWQCVVEFETFAMPVTVAVDDSTEVVAAVPGGTFRGIKPLREIKPN